MAMNIIAQIFGHGLTSWSKELLLGSFSLNFSDQFIGSLVSRLHRSLAVLIMQYYREVEGFKGALSGYFCCFPAKTIQRSSF